MEARAGFAFQNTFSIIRFQFTQINIKQFLEGIKFLLKLPCQQCSNIHDYKNWGESESFPHHKMMKKVQ